MRINFACGKQVWPGFYNIDAVRNPKAPRDPELLHALQFDPQGVLLNPVPLQDGCADEIHSMHFLEHVYAWEAPALLSEWRRLLKAGGRLVLELPNIEAAARNLLAGMNDQMCMWPLYGDPGHRDPYMCHKYGYTPKTVQQLLIGNGFTRVVMMPPKTHGARANRDMRVEARKP
ncbi:MAG: methyltransferase domain-containing protein [Gammaproteobacteria bacterium]|nr:methyltransferase domain-containing protein [Gammaproteobacteria bacterium]